MTVEDIILNVGGNIIARKVLSDLFPPNTVTSQFFRFTNSDIAASGFEVMNFEDRGNNVRKYLPFMFCLVTNTSDVDVKVYINQRSNAVKVLKALNAITISEPVRSITIENIGSSTISEGDIEVICKNLIQ